MKKIKKKIKNKKKLLVNYLINLKIMIEFIKTKLWILELKYPKKKLNKLKEMKCHKIF